MGVTQKNFYAISEIIRKRSVLTLPSALLIICARKCPVLIVYILSMDDFCQHSSKLFEVEFHIVTQFLLLSLDVCLRLPLFELNLPLPRFPFCSQFRKSQKKWNENVEVSTLSFSGLRKFILNPKTRSNVVIIIGLIISQFQCI